MTRLEPFSLNQESEAQFQTAIINLASLTGWLAHAERKSINRKGKWATPIQGHTGFFDLVLSHRERQIIIFAELKIGRNRVTPDQQRWHDSLSWCNGSERTRCVVWRPADWQAIEQLLRGDNR